jgi:hypothetical protein
LIEDPKARRVHPRDGFVVPRRLAYAIITGCLFLGALVGALLLRSGV